MDTRLNRIIAGAIVVPAAGALAAPEEVTARWETAADGNWSTSTSWDPDGVPDNSGDTTFHVIIDDSGSGVIVNADGNVTISSLRIDTGDGLDILAGRVFRVAEGPIVNNGDIFLSSTGSAAILRVDGDTTLEGGGTVTFGSHAQNRIDAQTTGDRLINVDNLIRGAGSLGMNFMSLTNQGWVVANDAAVNLFLDPPPNGDFTNESVFRAQDGAFLVLNAGTYHNIGGLIEALDGSQVSLGGNLTINGGELATDGTGVIRATHSHAQLNDVLNSGELRLDNGVLTRISGAFQNTGLIGLDSSGSSSILRIDGDLSLTGGGTIALGSHFQNRIDAQTTGDRLTNVDNVIEGGGQLGMNFMSLTNQSLIHANDPAVELRIDPDFTGDVTNESVIRASNGATLGLNPGNYFNTGGVIEVLDGSFVSISGGVTITGGELSAEGTGEFRCTQSSPRFYDITCNADVFVDTGVVAIVGGTFDNTGTFSLESTGAATHFRIDGDLDLVGGGTIAMGSDFQNRIDALTTGDRLTNVDHVIEGGGQIGSNFMSLTNQSLIHANDPAIELRIDPDSGGDVTNESVIRASSGATLGLYPGVYDNTSGVIEALDGSTITISGGLTLTGGELRTEGSGFVTCTSTQPVFADLKCNADLRIDNGVRVAIEGTLNNGGTVTLQSTGTATSLRSNGDTWVTGGGTIRLDGNFQNRIDAQTTHDRFTNVDNTIEGAGQIGLNFLSVTNEGTIDATHDTNAIAIDPPGNGDFTNTGTLRASGAAGVVIWPGPMTTSGTVEIFSKLDRTFGDYTQTGGTTTVAGELEIDSGVADLQGGTLGGNGLVDGDVVVDGGVVAPGASAGVLSVDGNYSHTRAGTIAVEIGGIVPGDEHDQLQVTGVAELAGTLDVSHLDKYMPTIGDEFVVIVAAEIIGRFECLELPDLDAGYYHVRYTDTEVKLLVEIDPPNPYDLDGDGAVGFSDLLILLAAWGPCPEDCCPADFNEDGSVTFADLLQILANWT